ncbi:hypothetical protein CMK14_00680 [Candidatus Poribacteria bacterium]|nr:hypothetical protein [Candidatus Poribacteria bacterium]
MDEITKTTKFSAKMLANVLDTAKTSFNTSESSIHEENQYTYNQKPQGIDGNIGRPDCISIISRQSHNRSGRY